MQILSETIRNYSVWQWVILLILLIPATIQDIREKAISTQITIVGLVAGLIINISLRPDSIFRILLCILPGIFLLACSYVTKEAIGYGDGIILLAIGNIVGLEACTKILFSALMIAGFFSIGLMTTKRAERNTTVPFVPFLLMGVLGIGVI